MQLTVTTDYAIRILVYLSKTKRVTPASEIAEKIKIAKKSLLATANKLKSARLIAGHMGVSGGYSLMRNPEDITLLEIMEVSEGPIKISRCQEDKLCDGYMSQKCPVHDFYDEVQLEINQRFADMTIQKLLEERNIDSK